MKLDSRIYGEKVEIDYGQTLDFFEKRGGEKALESKYNYVLFQDDTPEIAIRRDMQEKERISALLDWDSSDTVLDIGCGIGRWGEFVLDKGLRYIGIDYSRKLLGIAEENLESFGQKKILLHGSFQKFKDALLLEGITERVQKVFINGVMMYINDADLENGLNDVLSVCDTRCEIYLKESMSTGERLTLSEFYSDSLSQEYTAIYREIGEYRGLVEKGRGKVI